MSGGWESGGGGKTLVTCRPSRSMASRKPANNRCRAKKMKKMFLAMCDTPYMAILNQKGHLASINVVIIIPCPNDNAMAGKTMTKQIVLNTASDVLRVVIPIHIPNHATQMRVPASLN